MTELTAKQQKFVEEYLIDLNATQAAIRAGYSEQFGSRNRLRELNQTEILKTPSPLAARN